MKLKYIFLILFFAQAVFAQKSFVVTNVTIHVGNGEVIEKGAIAVKNGKIVEVGTQNKVATKGYELTIDGKGQHAYPGFIAPNTQLGLVEIEAVRATNDFREVGNFNPNIRSIIAYNTDSEIIPTIRSNGVLIAQIAPQGGRMPGQSSMVHLDGYNWEDALLKSDNIQHLNWPNRYAFGGWWAEPGETNMNKNYGRDMEGIKLFFDAALAYSQNAKPETVNMRFEAMRGLFNKTKKLFVHVDEAQSMLEAYELLKDYKIDLVYVGAAEAWRVTDFLKINNISVILGNVHALPRYEHEDVDLPYKIPAILYEKGVKFALSLDGSWQQRNIMFQAGHAVGYGLPKEQALAAITLNSAEILGVSDRVGSLQVGKDATFILSKGDALDMRTSVITEAFIQGRQVSLNDKQKDLYKKFMDKYGFKEVKG
jgi:imidazolonepropionase-like amidohydrolase